MVMNNRCATWSTKETTPTQHTAKESDTHTHTTQVKYKQTRKVMENHNVKEDMNQQVCYHCSFQKAFISDDMRMQINCQLAPSVLKNTYGSIQFIYTNHNNSRIKMLYIVR